MRLGFSAINVADFIVGSLNNQHVANGTFLVKDDKDYTINEIIHTLKQGYSQNRKPILSIPACLPRIAFKLIKLISSQRGDFLLYNLDKIAQSAIYFNRKIRSTEIALKWDLENTLFGIHE